MQTMQKKVFVIGGATIDTIIEYEEMESMILQKKSSQNTFLLLEEGKKIEVTHEHHLSGGGATNTAVSFKRQGFEVGLFCKVGRDAYGEMILKELKEYDLDISLIRRSHQVGTANSFVVPTLSGDRTLFAYRGANATLLTEDLPLQKITDYDFIYITSLSQASAARLPEITKAALAANMLVAVNPGISQLKLGGAFLKTALSGIDILILNYEEAEQFMISLMQSDEELRQTISAFSTSHKKGSLLDAPLPLGDLRFNLRQFFREVLTLGPSHVVVTHGAGGVYVGTQDALYFHPALKVQHIANTLGAGDAFGSSFVGALVRGESIENAMRYGLNNSASVIQYHDAKSGLLTQEALKTKVEQTDPTLCQKQEFTFHQV